jgi:hypothetical protein
MVPAHSTRMSSRPAAISHSSAISGSNSERLTVEPGPENLDQGS